MQYTDLTTLPRHVSATEPLGSSDRESLDIDAIIRFAQRSWRLCLIWLGVGLCASIAFLIVSPAYYTAYSTVLFYNSAPRPAAGAGNTADGIAPAYVDTQVEVLQSEEVLGRVIDQNRLIEDREFGAGREATDPEARHATMLRLNRALSVRRIGVSDAVTVGFTSKNRLHSAMIVNAIIQTYVEWRLDLRRNDSAESASDLRKRLAEVQSKAFASDHAASSVAPLSAAEARARFRELQQNMEAYNNLLQQAHAASASEFSPLGVRVLTPAEPPLGRSSPRLIFVFVIAVAAAGAAGIGHALLREATNRSLRTVEDVQRITGLDCVVGVPKIEGHARVTAEVHAGAVQLAYLNDSADFCQALVGLAVRLQEPKQRQFVIGVVAPTGGGGTSSVSAHLANILAERGQKTLLVDANWQKPSTSPAMPTSSLHQIQTKGLAAIHLESGRVDVLVLRAMAPISPVNASNSIVSTLQHLQSKYECVVVDFHSTDQTADLAASSTVINGVVVVVEAGQATAESLLGLLRVLPRDKIEAVMVNKIAPGPPDLSAEFAAFVGPLVRASRTALAMMPLLFERLATRSPVAGGEAKLLHPAEFLGTWLHRTSRRARRQLRCDPGKDAPAE